MWLCLSVDGCTHWEVVQRQAKCPKAANHCGWVLEQNYIISLPEGQWGELGTLLYQHGFPTMKTSGIIHFLQYSRRPLTLGIPTAITSQEGGLPMQKGIKWKTRHQKKGCLKLSIGSISPVYCTQAL